MISLVIPAKGISERIPRKNLTMFQGKPLVQHSIGYAFNEGHQPVVVSGDAEILKVTI